MTSQQLATFDWKRYPETAEFLNQRIDTFCAQSSRIKQFASDLQTRTGTRLIDWVDHFELHWSDELEQTLAGLGYEAARGLKFKLFQHPAAHFPAIQASTGESERLSVRVDSVVDFLAIHQCALELPIEGTPGASVRQRLVFHENGVELHVIERHGVRIDTVKKQPDPDLKDLLNHTQAFRLRKRDFAGDIDGFEHAESMIRIAIEDLGVDLTCDLFFAAERAYWQQRNVVARIQKGRQDLLGVGWANHDHHTYRSSRTQFWRLISLFELLGFQLRERFYAGKEAGWGAQVLEHPTTGVVIFADVDLSPEEVSQDFAHEPLPELNELGTVGLWCRLHGEAFLQAGMHHLECLFDFTAARDQLADENDVKTMKPFTDLPHLKQAFTAGEIWPVEESRIQSLLDDGLITIEEADKFREKGAIGSHLEILQREEGFKGFNQSGINDIIQETNPLKQ
ncbi:hypothetical protein [uncultured Gimesia sp.]|uniref:hypothetical protein n=1 Tax=uncultured Gimesia sp. TaxID=1678688 RepID=UPI0030DD18B1|tara:strand:+ start:73401 stop:74759 length:1359 start_codon:yes stop_codon:yes gene_type:complete